jgi:hypothetical protein
MVTGFGFRKELFLMTAQNQRSPKWQVVGVALAFAGALGLLARVPNEVSMTLLAVGLIVYTLGTGGLPSLARTLTMIGISLIGANLLIWGLDQLFLSWNFAIGAGLLIVGLILYLLLWLRKRRQLEA